MDERRFEKGFFTRNRFAVADKHLALSSRKRLFVYGAIAAGVLAIVFLADAFVGRASTIASGAMSTNHALFAKDCATCHSSFKGTSEAKCQSCHAKGVASGSYSFDRHYEYHSGLVDRSAPKRKEVACGSCHREHEGRTASLRQVADAQCKSCHDVGRFKKHPEFDFVAKKTPDPANLKFTHGKHVREVMGEYEIKDAEEACLRCHEPQADGRNFKPLSYARSCDGCHLGSKAETQPIPVNAGSGPGVATLGAIRAAGGPDAQWAFYYNPNDFSDDGGTVSKRPVYHEDPWVMYNLQKLRLAMYPGSELADLLRASPEATPREARELHREAVRKLRAQLDALRGSDSEDVQREIQGLESLIKQIEERIEQPQTTLDETRLGVTAAQLAPGIDANAYNTVVNALTEPCQVCHVVENATIRRVQKDQRSLIRAEFDHRAHTIHARCLDCHTQIPIRKALEKDEDLPEAEDRAEILNVPAIAECKSCHTKRAAAVSCTSCHVFHPDKSQ